MKATDELRAEHGAILLIIDVLDRISDRITAGDGVEPGHLKQILEVLHVFVDRCHHGKEEGVLFPALVDAGGADVQEPVRVMLSEHERGRKFIGDMNTLLSSHEAGNAGALMVFTTPALQYTDLLRSHIWKENSVLFHLAEEVIPEARQEEIAQKFEHQENEGIGAWKYQEYHAMVEKFAALYL